MEKQRLSTFLTVRLTPEERRLLEERAAREKRNVSSFARLILTETLPRPRGKRGA